jgi:hypothetical protein
MMPGFTAEVTLEPARRPYATVRSSISTAVPAAVHPQAIERRTMLPEGGGDLQATASCKCPCCIEVAGHLVCCS